VSRIGWRGWLVAGLIFLLGGAAGVTCTVVVGKRVLRNALVAPADAPGRADRVAARVAADISENLQLTSEQSERVREILADSAQNLKAIRRQAAVDVGAELRRSTQRIAAELPPEKRAELYRVIAGRFTRIGITAPEPPAK
jgi:hypothetical protein